MASLFLGTMEAILRWTGQMTDIDRRRCERIVPMKVLVLGLSRTGTSSIRQALRDLGYHDVYHAACIYKENPRDADMWVDAFEVRYEGRKDKEFGRREWDQLLGHCMAVTDTPCTAFRSDLIHTYPEAKIILSLRDSPQQWATSVRNTLIPFANYNNARDPSLWDRLYKYMLPRLRFNDLNEKLMLHTDFREWYDEDSAVRKYDESNEEVRQMVRASTGPEQVGDRLLEFNVKQGWRPLCEFLGLSVPVDERGEQLPFPRVNDTNAFQQNDWKLRRVTDFLVAVNLLVSVGAVGGIGYGAWWALRQARSTF